MIEELITEKVDVRDKESYYNAIIQTIIRVGRAGEFIVALCELIHALLWTIYIYWEIFMTEVRAPHDYGQADDLPFPGHPVGKPRCAVDGGGCRTEGMYCKCNPHLCQIRQSGYPGGWLRY